MITLGRTAAILAAVLGWLAALFAVQPFDYANLALDRIFGALPPWTQVENVRVDAATQEVSRGEDPLRSFATLERAWSGRPGRRIILMGNSQTQMVSLAKGEPPPLAPEKTYADQLADTYARENGALYRLSAGALSYEEMLWYATYLAVNPAIKPDALLVQLNYQNFVNGGIRGGMLSLLSHPDMRRRIEEQILRGRPESPVLAEAVREYDRRERAAAAQGPQGAPAAASAAGWGERVEAGVRGELDRVPGFGRRAALKQSFTLMLFRCRTYLFHIAPTARRSLGGARVAVSRAALEDLADVCARAGIRLALFQAPTNPLVPLYRTAGDDRAYHEFTNGLAARRGLPLLDFEHSIPAADWGMTLNVPDPLHLSRAGHRILASEMAAALKQNGL